MSTQEKKTLPRTQSIGKTDPLLNTFEGKVVSISANKLVMTNEGKEYSHLVAPNAKVTCDGTDCEADELKAGSRIRVTTKKDNRSVATCVEALDKKSEFAECVR